MEGTGAEESSGLPTGLPESDRPLWEGMTALQRDKARSRLAAIEEWQAGRISLADALQESGLSRTRFYTVAAQFRTSPTLGSLGAFAGSGAAKPRLDPRAINELQKVVGEIVANNRGTSISGLVRLMIEAAGVDERRLPGATRLRRIVEAEIRRADATGEAGHAIKMDFTAINLPQQNRRPYIMFALLDEGTRLILGASIQPEPALLRGYRSAAENALVQLQNLPDLCWTDRFVRAEVTVCDNKERASQLRSIIKGGGVHANVQFAPARYGRYIRKLVGSRFGRIEITPLRTMEGEAVPDNGEMRPWSLQAASGALSQAVEEHNRHVLSELGSMAGRTVAPDDLAHLLDVLAEIPDLE